MKLTPYTTIPELGLTSLKGISNTVKQFLYKHTSSFCKWKANYYRITGYKSFFSYSEESITLSLILVPFSQVTEDYLLLDEKEWSEISP